MLITGIRKEIFMPYISISGQADENNESELISTSTFISRLLLALICVIDIIEMNNNKDLKVFWSHVMLQINNFASYVQDDVHRPRPMKFVSTLIKTFICNHQH